MLTAKNASPQNAIDYFSQGYYDAEQTRWFGKGAAALGLNGKIDNKEIFANVCNALSPDGRTQLGAKSFDSKNRRAALDCTFSAPKSVSFTALVGGDERLEIAHRTAVEKTLALIEERYASTRVRVGAYRRPKVQTGNLVVAQFDHIESRELDPHMHTHALLMNLTQIENGDWYSLSNNQIFANKKHLGMVYQSYLAQEVQLLGYETIARPHGQFEIKGYKREDLVEFSKRRQQILSEVGADSSWISRENAWSITRKSKEKILPNDLFARWRDEATALGIAVVKPREKSQRPENSSSITVDHLDDAIAHCSERNVEFSREDLENFILTQGLAPDVREFTPLIKNHPQLKRLGDNGFTTLAALQREDDTITCMARGRGKVDAIALIESVNNSLNESTLNTGQRQAIRLSATTTDRVVAWQGVAGAGKTFALKQLKAIALLNGYEILGFAPSAEAAKVLGNELGIEANTVARKLVTQLSDELPTNQIWVVDEAGLLGANDALNLLRLCERENARIVLVGDTKQLSSVAAGNPFKSLQQAGMKTAVLSESLRQRTPELKIAVDLLADGMVAKGFKKLEDNGSIIELATDAIVNEIASEYMLIPFEKRAKTLVLSGTNARRQEITDAIREKLRAEGTIGIDASATRLQPKNLTTVQMKYAHNFDVGDVVIPVRDYKRRGLVKGEHYLVEEKVGDRLILKSGDGQQFEVDTDFEKALYAKELTNVAVGDRLKWTKNDHKLGRRNGQEFSVEAIEWNNATIKYEDGSTEIIDLEKAQHLDHALVTTTFSSQGKTADRVFWASDFTASAENFYVAVSRAKYDLKIFTDNSGKLLDLAQESKANANPRDLVRRQELLTREREIVAAMPVPNPVRPKTQMPDIREIIYNPPNAKPKPTPVTTIVLRSDLKSIEDKPQPVPKPVAQMQPALQYPTVDEPSITFDAPNNIDNSQAYIEELLQQSSQDLLLLDNYIRNYFLTPASEIDSPHRESAKRILDALNSPSVSLKVNIQTLLKTRGRDLVQLDDYIRKYLLSPQAEIDSEYTHKAKEVLAALDSPEVSKRTSIMKVERERILEIHRSEWMDLNQPRRGRGR